jgi:phosphate transport system substrate-binding protein
MSGVGATIRGWRQSLLAGAAAAVLAAGLQGCRARPEAITIAGATGFQPCAEQLAEAFMAAHPGLRITVQNVDSAVGIQAALNGVADIGVADVLRLPADASNLVSAVIGYDAIAVIVNPANAVTNLTLGQVRDIYCGRIRTWSAAGGASNLITVVSREEGSGTRRSFEQVLGGVALMNNAIIQDTSGAVRSTVAGDADAIGYLSQGLLGAEVRALRLDGVSCAGDEVSAGRYPLMRPVYLLTRGNPEGAVKQFIDYVLSPAGQQIVRDRGIASER